MEENKEKNLEENEKNVNDSGNKSDDDGDLEDGEIETDDDEPVIISDSNLSNVNSTTNGNSQQIHKNDISSPLKDKNDTINDEINSNNANNATTDTINASKIDLTSMNEKSTTTINLLNQPTNKSSSIDVSTPTNKKSKAKFVDDDWAGNIENAIAAALKKEGVILPKALSEHERDHDSGHSDDGGGGGGDLEAGGSKSRKAGKKRKKRENDKKAKKKMKHHDDTNEEIDDYEMLCIRGGSPPPVGTVHHHHHHHHHPPPPVYYDSDNSYSSYDSYDSQEYKSSSYQERRQIRKMKDRRRKGDRGENDSRKRVGNEKRKRMNDDRDDGVCILNMRGFCPNGDDCPKSHDCRSQRKLELCKFYLMECCAKKDKCSYMHSDFPCKYYYLGMECIYKGACKFSHGKPLTEQLRNILLKHIETAPKEILGNFRRIGREHAITLMNATHAKLCAEQGIENTLAPPTLTTSSITTVNSNIVKSNDQQQQQSSIPSLLDIVIKPPIPSPRKDDKLLNVGGALKEKQRKSRWCDNNISSSNEISPPVGAAAGGVAGKTNLSVPDVLSLRNLSGVITPEQIEKLAAMGIENLEQINQLTVAQLNSIGLTITQIGEIQLNALNIQKLGLIKSSASTPAPSSYLGNLTTSSSSPSTASSVSAASASPSSSSINSSNRQSGTASTLEFINPSGLYSDSTTTTVSLRNQANPTQDIDMRFLIGGTTSTTPDNPCSSPNNKSNTNSTSTTLVSSGIASPDAIQPARSGIDYETDTRNETVNSLSSAIDYSQYLKDSNLDAEKTDLNDISLDKDDGFNEDEPELLIDESWMDPNDEEKDTNTKNDNQNNDSDENMKSIPKVASPDMWAPIANIGQICYKTPLSYHRNSDEENWDTDNDDSENKEKKQNSKHDDDDNDSSNNTINLMSFNSLGGGESREFRGDPRLQKQSVIATSNNFSGDYNTSVTNDSVYCGGNDNTNDNWMGTTTTSSNISELIINSGGSTLVSKYQRASIYDGNPSDIGNEDENSTTTRKKFDKDMRMSSFIDSSNSDIDLRLPFKPVMTNYTPATEIDGSISSHGPIPYKVVEIEIPKPDYSEIRRNIPVSEKILDPRLRRIFCLKESIASTNELEGGNDQAIDINYFSTNRGNNAGVSSSGGSVLQKREDSSDKTNNSGISGIIANTTSNNNNISSGPRADPRRRKESQDLLASGNGSGNTNSTSNSADRNQSIDIRMILQKSNWYKNLNSKFKIMVNQQLALISAELKKFHQDTSPNKVFDISFIVNNQYLQQILSNLCIYIDINGILRQLESDNDGDGSSSMPGIMGMGGLSGIDPNAATNVQQMVGSGTGLVMPPVNGPAAQLGGMLSNIPGAAAAAAAGMYMRGAPPLMSQFRPRYENIRPGLLGIAPGIQFNTFDSSLGGGINECGGDSGYIGGNNGNDDKNNFNAFLSGGNGAAAGGVGNLFDQNNFFGRSGGDGNLQSSGNRGIRNNFRQGNAGGGSGGGGRNQNERWNTGNSGNIRDSNNSRRNFDNKNRGGETRREKSQKSKQIFDRDQNTMEFVYNEDFEEIWLAHMYFK